MAVSPSIANQQRSYEVFEKKHYMECTTASLLGTPRQLWMFDKPCRRVAGITGIQQAVCRTEGHGVARPVHLALSGGDTLQALAVPGGETIRCDPRGVLTWT